MLNIQMPDQGVRLLRGKRNNCKVASAMARPQHTANMRVLMVSSSQA